MKELAPDVCMADFEGVMIDYESIKFTRDYSRAVSLVDMKGKEDEISLKTGQILTIKEVRFPTREFVPT